MKPEDIHVELKSDARLLQSVRGLVTGYVVSLGFSEGKVEDIVLAVDEACSNAIRHAYCGCPDRCLTLSLTRAGKNLEIMIRDSGKPAPAERVAPPRASRGKKRDVTPGGLGIPLMHRVFDKVDFERGRTRGNCVTLRLRLPRQGKAKRKRK
ncbi:MAG: ATP-binding protein [bacterium]|nr:ATP-binding protein [bacterium]